MTSTDGQLYSRDEQDIPFLSVMKEVPIKGRVMMIGDGKHVKPLIGSFGDEFFRRISYAVKRIVSRVKMEIRLQGSQFLTFIARVFNQFSGTSLKGIQTYLILIGINRTRFAFL
jgi:hypothetical protein